MQPTILPAQIPAPVAATLRQLGAVINPLATEPLYAPLHPREPYDNATVARDQAFGSHPLQRLDVFAPAPPAAAPRPILLFVHGGGFVRGDKRGAGSPFYDNIMLWAAGSGLLGININYRLAPSTPGPPRSKTSPPPCCGRRATPQNMAAIRSASSCAGIPPARRTSPNTSPIPRCGWAATACAAQYWCPAFTTPSRLATAPPAKPTSAATAPKSPPAPPKRGCCNAACRC